MMLCPSLKTLGVINLIESSKVKDSGGRFKLVADIKLHYKGSVIIIIADDASSSNIGLM